MGKKWSYTLNHIIHLNTITQQKLKIKIVWLTTEGRKKPKQCHILLQLLKRSGLVQIIYVTANTDKLPDKYHGKLGKQNSRGYTTRIFNTSCQNARCDPAPGRRVHSIFWFVCIGAENRFHTINEFEKRIPFRLPYFHWCGVFAPHGIGQQLFFLKCHILLWELSTLVETARLVFYRVSWRETHSVVKFENVEDLGWAYTNMWTGLMGPFLFQFNLEILKLFIPVWKFLT